MCMNKCLVLFIEGDTEIEFYKKLVSVIREKRSGGQLDTKIIYRNVKGIGGYKKEVTRIFKKEILAKNKNYTFTVALCRDTDVFEFAQKPKIKWHEVEKQLKEDGAKRVIHVHAVKAIEDWFLYDLEGICKYLKIPLTQPSGKNGYEKLGYLFRRANKTYIKGRMTKGFVESLDLGKIVTCIWEELSPICKILGVKEIAKDKVRDVIVK